MTNLRMVKNEREKTALTRKGIFFDYSMLIIVLFLVVFGLVMIYSTSSYSAMLKEGDSAFYFKNQMRSTVIGLVGLFAATVIDYHVWYKLKWVAYIGALISVLLILVPKLGKEINGARRWIHIAGMSVQPAEIVKLGVIILLAAFISYSGSKMKSFRNNVAFCILAGIAGAMILFITRNMSSAIIILGIAYVMLMISNSKPRWLIIATVIGVIAVAAFLAYFFGNITSASHFRFKRLLAWRNPENYASDVGMQTLQALYALGSGGFFGKGLGQSIQKLGFLPEAQNDMIFSIICEELGLFGGICLILLFVLLIWRFMVIANNAPDLFGSMLVVGVMAHISIQVVLNVAVATNLIPNTGVTLPFISYGGTSVLFLLAEMGIVLNVSRQIRVPVAVSHRESPEH